MSGLTPYDPIHGPKEMGTMWTMTKGAQRLRCVLWTHPLGWELRVASGGQMARPSANSSQKCSRWPKAGSPRR